MEALEETYLVLAIQLQVLLRFQDPGLDLLLSWCGLDTLGDVAQNLASTQHAVCVETVVALSRISIAHYFV